MNKEVKSANDAARFFLSKMKMSQKKLHKMLYFAYSLYLVENNEDVANLENVLFDNTFEAWVHGPVLREIYPIYAGFSYKQIDINSVEILLPKKAMSICNEILRDFGHLSADELERISHEETAWLIPRIELNNFEPSNERLSDLLIYESALERFYV